MKNFKKFLNVLCSTSLFGSIKEDDLTSMLLCMNAEVVNIAKNEIILFAGNRPEHVGIVLSGRLYIVKEDSEGNRTLVAAITPGEVYAEALCCAGVPESPVTVIADVDSVVMLLPFERILHTCSRSCTFHTRLIENMMGLIARKNLMLQSRMDIISTGSLRTKVLRYLRSFDPEPGRNIMIPFNREELADYLCVDRSALSHELSRMKKDGLLDYKKNSFTLL